MRKKFNPTLRVRMSEMLSGTPSALLARSQHDNAHLAYEKRVLSQQVARLTMVLQFSIAQRR